MLPKINFKYSLIIWSRLTSFSFDLKMWIIIEDEVFQYLVFKFNIVVS